MTNHREMALPLCKELLAEIGRGRIDKSRLTANFRWKSNGGNDFTAAQVNERLPVLLSSTEDGFRVEQLAAIVEGQRVAIEAVSHAKLRTGTVYRNRQCFVFNMEGDLIAQVFEYTDTLHTMEVFG